MKSTIRFCPDIGMFAYDRQISASCVHATDFCRKPCFNDKLYKIYPAMHGKDIRNEAFWAGITGEAVRVDLKRKHKQTSRVRLMTRGESFSNLGDIAWVVDILQSNPDSVFWIPTRGWRDPLIRLAIESRVMEFKNARVMASMDVTNTDEEWESVKLSGWSTMFFGDNDMAVTPNNDRPFKCPKTFKHMNGHCEICKGGCFNPNKRVDVHLKQH